jgi:formylglycine-generating enzyme required for sulfatase activity
MMMVATALCFGACDDGGGSGDARDSGAAGDAETFTVNSVSFVMVFVPGGVTFPTGIYDDEGEATVDNAYWIGETEVTYELWKKVYDWATSGTTGTGAGEYTFANQGREGNDGTIGAAATNQEPVTTVNWRDSMVWCNALTEWYNAHNGSEPDRDCAYYSDSGYVTPIRSADDTGSFDGTAGGQDNPYVKAAAKGFRLLASNEWELAARWRDDATNTVDGYTNPYFTKGYSASGAATYCDDSTNGNGEPGKTANDAVAVYSHYWDGDSWEPTGVTGTATVRSKGVSGANALGLYDMSGNVWEWCFDLSGSSCGARGGSWDFEADSSVIGFCSKTSPYGEAPFIGFRFARSAD